MRALTLLTIACLTSGCAGAGTEGVLDAGASPDSRAKDLATPATDDAQGPLVLPDWLDGGTPRPDTTLGPPYPIVLVHGMAGFQNIGPIEYFYGVPEALRKDGHDIWVSRADPINDSETRGKQVLTFVVQVLNATNKRKVNLIGHSQGGFEVRYVASLLPDYVASATVIASPLDGDPIADVALSAGPGAQGAIGALLNLYGGVAGFDSNAKACFGTLSTAGARAFAAKYPDDKRVDWFSITGRSALADSSGDCAVADAPAFIRKWDHARDPLNPFLGVISAILEGQIPRGSAHDGLVPVRAAKVGHFLGCVPADHLDEVGQIAGQPPGLGNDFNEVEFYRDLANFLVARGY